MNFFKKKLKDFFEDFFENIPIMKVIKKQACVACVILFAPYGE